MIRLGVIGAGTRATHLAATAVKQDPAVRLAAVVDPDRVGAETRLAEAGVPTESAAWFDHVRALYDEAVALDGVLIGTRCDIHTQVAMDVAALGLPVFMEKPVGITRDQLEGLRIAFAGRDEQVVVSFPLRLSPLFEKTRDLVRRGRLGKINQITAVNFVPYGGVYFGQWYRDSATTGGMWLQKATHDFDYLCELAMAEPVGVMAMDTQRIYGGDMPDDLMCSACDLASSCPESPRNIALRDDDGGMGKEDHLCAFSKSIKHHDAGSAMIMFENGVHASYSQNFVSRRSAFSRGARVTGYEATLEFDWADESITITEHHGSAVEHIKVAAGSEHHGGDDHLIRNFLEVIRGDDVSRAPLRLGLRSAELCLAACDSAASGKLEMMSKPGRPTPSLTFRR
ncbi:MAG: Gfo/Idh/MocA family oxidoreductase [Planctomycetota bacterium]